MKTLASAAPLIILLALFLVGIAAVIDASLIPGHVWKARGRSKAATILLLVITGFVGGTYYGVLIRRGLRRQAPGGAHPNRERP